ncbi:hypothetical protein ABPG75_004219 [Micractinium tetrahymenae]
MAAAAPNAASVTADSASAAAHEPFLHRGNRKLAQFAPYSSTDLQCSISNAFFGWNCASCTTNRQGSLECAACKPGYKLTATKKGCEISAAPAPPSVPAPTSNPAPLPAINTTVFSTLPENCAEGTFIVCTKCKSGYKLVSQWPSSVFPACKPQ